MPFIANIAAKLASKYLGEYFDGVEKKNIEASLTSGETIFRNLTLKSTALDQFNLPIEVKEGTLAKLVLKVPWTSLGSDSTVVRIEEFFVTLGPKPRSSQTATAADEVSQARKKQRLKLAALLRQDQPAEDKERIKQEKKAEKKEKRKDEGKFSLAQTLQKKVLANLQLYVDKIHVRYEDNVSNPDQAFCFGFTLEMFHAQTASASWEPTIVKMKEQIVHKLVELRNLSFYFDTPKERNAVILRSKNSTTAKLMALHLYQDGQPPPDHNYIISPLSGIMHLTMDQRRENLIDYTIPKLQCEVTLETAGIAVNKPQYSAAMEFLQYVQSYQKSSKYLRYRPDFEAAPNKARALWKFAIDCVLSDIRKNYQSWTWDSILARKRDRLTYVALYTKKQQEGKKKLLPSEVADIERIEAKYSYDDLLLYRKLANTAILKDKLAKKNPKDMKEQEKQKDKEKDKKDKDGKDKDKDKSKDKEKKAAEKAAEKEAQKERERLEKLEKEKLKADKKAGKKGNSILSALQSQSGSNFDSDDVMEELYFSLGVEKDKEDAAAKDTVKGPPPGYVKTELKFRLNSVTLGLSELATSESRFATVTAQGLGLTLLMKAGGSLTLTGDCGRFNIFDYHTLGGRELALLRPDPRHDTTARPLASFSFEKNPLEDNVPATELNLRSSSPSRLSIAPSPSASPMPLGSPDNLTASTGTTTLTPVHVDYRIKAVAFPIYITVSRPFIDRIIAFFKVSKGKSKKVGATVANKAAKKLKKAGQKNIQKALKKRKVTQIDIDVTAPRIIIPESFVGDDNAAMIIDFGHLLAKSCTAAPIPPGLGAAERALAKKEANIYDHYDISVKGITCYFVWSQSELEQMVTGGLSINRNRQTQSFSTEDIAGGSSPNTLLRRLDVNLNAKLLQRAPTGKLPRFKVTGSMTGIELDLSTNRVGALMGCIRAVTKKTTAKQHADLIKAKNAYLDARGRSGSTGAAASSKRVKIDQSELIEALETADLLEKASKSKDKDSSSPTRKISSKPYKLAMAVGFTIPSIMVVVHHQMSHNPVPVPLISASLQNAKFHLIKSTHDMRAGVRLKGLYVEDQFLVRSGLGRADRAPYYVVNTINQRGLALVQIDFIQIPQKSPQWKGVTNNLKVAFNALEVNLNRPTLAALVATVADYVRAMKKKKPVTSSATGVIEAMRAERGLMSSSGGDTGSSSDVPFGLSDFDAATWSAATASLGTGPSESKRRSTAALKSQKASTDLLTASTNTSNGTHSPRSDLSRADDIADQSSLTSTSTSSGPKIDLKAQLALLAQEHAKQQELEGPQKKASSKAADKRSQLKLDVSVSMVRINFNRDTKTWFVTRFGGIGLSINKHVDGTSLITGSLAAISARDKNEERWHDIISISAEEAASIRFEQFKETVSDYPGYKHSVNMHVASIRIVILQRLFKEISKYFGGVSQMKKFLGTGAKGTEENLELQRQLEQVESQRIAEAKKKKSKSGGEKSALRLHIELENPLLIIPKSGDAPEHLQLDLGRILVTNSFSTQGSDVKVDVIDVAASGLNIRAFVRDDTTTAKRLLDRPLLSDVNMNASIIRPLANNQNFTVPDIQLIANMSKFDIFISENELALVFGIISGNVSEFTLREDGEMAIVLKYLESAHLQKWWNSNPAQQQKQKEGQEQDTKPVKLQKKTDLSAAAAAAASSSAADPTPTDVPTAGSENASLKLSAISPAPTSASSAPNTARGPLAKDARKVLEQITRVKLSVKLNFDQLTATFYRGSGTDYLGQATSLARVGINSFRFTFAMNADKGKVLKLNLINIVLEDASDTRNQFKRLLASIPKDREDIAGAKEKEESEEDSESEDSAAPNGSSTKPKPKKAPLSEDPETPSDTENSVFIMWEARPKIERYEVIAVKINRPRIYVVPTAWAALTLFFRPLAKVFLRTMSIFAKRKRLGSLGDQRRKATAAVEQMHARMQSQIQALEDSQAAEIEELQGKSGASKRGRSKSKMDVVSKRRHDNDAALSKLKAELESGFANFVADVGKKVRAGPPKERTIKVTLTSPEICVLEDPERSRNVFMVHLSDATIKMHTLGKNQNLSLHLFELDARKGQVDPVTNETSERILLIQPFDVVTRLERVNEQETKLNNIKIKIGVIHTIISYRDMKLALAVVRGLGALGKGVSASKQAVAKSVADTSVTPLRRYGVTETTVRKVKESNKVKPQLVLVFKVGVMNFTLLNDTNRLFVTPLLKIDIEGIETFLTRGYDMRLNLEVKSIKVHAYNIDLAAYEPIVEPWGLELLLKKEGKVTGINIKAEQLLSINLTRSLLDTVFNTLKFFSALSKRKTPKPGAESHANDDTPISATPVPQIALDSSDASPAPLALSHSNPGVGSAAASQSIQNVQSAERSFYPFILANGTCKAIKYWFSHLNENTAQSLEPDDELPIVIEKSSKQIMSGVGDEESSKFDIDVEIFFDDNDREVDNPERRRSVVLHKIPIDKVHTAKTYALPGEFSNVQFVSENVRKGGTKILTLRTTQNIVNNTNVDIEVQITKPHSSGSLIGAASSLKVPSNRDAKKNTSERRTAGRVDTHTMTIPSGKSKSIPLEFLNYSSMKLRTNGYEWCEWSNKESIVGICQRTAEASRRSSSMDDYWSCVIVYDRIEDDLATYVTITLNAALQFENLLASMVLIKVLQPGEVADDVPGVVDVDSGNEVAIYTSHAPTVAHHGSGGGNAGAQALDKAKYELQCTNGNSALSLTHQRFSICVGGFYWSEPVDLLQLYISAKTFKPGPQEKAAFERPMEVRDVNNRTLSFIAEVTEPTKGCLKIALYASYWIINQTGLKLNYRVNVRSPILVDDQARSTEIKGDPRSWYKEAEETNKTKEEKEDKKATYAGPGMWRLAAPTKFYFSGDEFQAQVAGYGTTEVQQGKMATVITAAMDKFGAGNGASQWSNSIPLTDRDAKKHNGDMEHMSMAEVKGPRIFEFYCGVKHAPGKFWRTQEIRIAPQYVLVNKTKRNLVYRQIDPLEAAGTPATNRNEALFSCDLLAGDQLPFHWPDSTQSIKQLSINYSADDPGLNEYYDTEHHALLDPNKERPETHWSGRFSIDAIDNLMIKIRDKANVERFDLINVSIKEHRGVKYVIFRAGSDDFIQLIRIENQSEWEIVVEQKLRINTSTTTATTDTHQVGMQSAPSQSAIATADSPKVGAHVQFTESVPIRTIQPYYWDEPHKRTKVLILHVKPPPGVPLSRNYSYSVSSLAEDASAGVDSYVYGWKANSKQRFKVQVQVRGFTKVVVVTSSGAGVDDIPEDGQIVEESPETKAAEDKSSIELEMDFGGIGLSIIDTFPQEIFYVSLKTATLSYKRVGKVHSFGFVAKTGQVDNQLYLAPDPLMVYGLNTDPSPFLSLNIDMDTTEKKIVYFTKIHMLVQRLELNVDQIAILAAAAFSSIASKAIKQQKMSQNVAFTQEDVIPLLADKYMRSDKYYFQNISLEAIKTFFSLRRATNKRLLPIVNYRLKRALTTVLKISSIERQKLVFSGFIVPSAFSSIRDMQRRVVKHYKSVIMSNVSSLLLNYVTKVVRTMWSGSIVPPVIQMRPPRFFPPDDLVVIYDRAMAYGQQLLRCLCEGAFYKEHYYFHYFLSGQELVLSSHKWLLMCRSSEYDSFNFTIIWKEKLDDIISFVAPESDTTIKIIFGATGEDPHFRELYCRTTEQSAFIASKIELAVSRNKFSSMTSIRRMGEEAEN